MPTATEYSQAIQNLHLTLGDEELKAGKVAVDPMGLPLQYTGNFAVVFQVHCPQTQNTWAVKCFTKDTKDVEHRRDRYRAISDHLHRARLPFMVDFQYQKTGILVGSRWLPLLKMRWVEGENLNRFVVRHLEKPERLRQLLGLWVKLAQRLRDAKVAHADLQHGNVLLVPARDRQAQKLMLVDYDGMHVPALAKRPPGELGHPAYQHPQRLREEIYSAAVDRFSHLAIYSAVRGLIAGGQKLWDRFDNGDNLLFREPDFASPGESELFHRLWGAKDGDLRALVGHLCLATQRPLDRVPLLDEVVNGLAIRPLESPERQEVARLIGKTGPVSPASAVEPSSPVPEAEYENELAPLDAAASGGDIWQLLHDAADLAGEPEDEPKFSDAAPVITSSIGMKLVLIPAGKFWMGSPPSDPDAGFEEKPQHRVWISKPFYLGATLVTQEQYERVMDLNPSEFEGDPPRPMETVKLSDAIEFCRRLGEIDGRSYRLPTEAEWEYACRAGTTTRWSFGNDESALGKHAWYASNSGGTTHPVAQKKPNAWGLYDMHGNVWEWCTDWYDGEYYASAASVDPTGPGTGSRRVVRGGSWNGGLQYCRSASRIGGAPGGWSNNLGFRVVTAPVESDRNVAAAGETVETTDEDIEKTPLLNKIEQHSGLAPATTIALASLGVLALVLAAVAGAIFSNGGSSRNSVAGVVPQAKEKAPRIPPTGPAATAEHSEAGDPSINGDAEADSDRSKPIAFSDRDAAGEEEDEERKARAKRDRLASLWSLAKESQETSANRLGIPVELTNSIGMELVLIPAADFWMGSPDSDSAATDDEKPQHRVWITRHFYMGVTEVTQEQYEHVIGENPSYFKSGLQETSFRGDPGIQMPVENVSWTDAVEFCRRLTRTERRQYRLPTEAEWEYACRAGIATKWCFGDDELLLDDYAWYESNSGHTTHSVGQKRANAWGLRDVHGNVWEWCADWYDERYYDQWSPQDPKGPEAGLSRVFRGGSFFGSGSYYGSAAACRSANRAGGSPTDRLNCLGFRVCLEQLETEELGAETLEYEKPKELVDPQALFAGIQSISFRFAQTTRKNSFQRMIEQQARQAAERAGLKVAANAPAVMVLRVDTDYSTELVPLTMSAELWCKAPKEARIRVTEQDSTSAAQFGSGRSLPGMIKVWEHRRVLREVSPKILRQMLLQRVLRPDVGDFFDKFAADYREASAGRTISEPPKR